MEYKPTNLLFLDLDGVLNCQLFYDEYFSHIERFDNIPLYKTARKLLRKMVKQKEITTLEYFKQKLNSKLQ